MFYYAEINSDYLVTNTHSLDASSTNENYIPITEEQYTSGDIVGKYYNSLTGDFEVVFDYMGDATMVSIRETDYAVSTKLDNMQSEINSKANADHTHTEYASSDDLALLEDVIDTKADTTHSHDGYASSTHTHNEYAEVNHSHSEYASAAHTHSDYATVTALETLESEVDGKASTTHTHSNYAEITHDHDEDYAAVNHSHTEYATTTSVSELSAVVSGKANTSHSHNDVYYTETEIDDKLADKADSSHTHTGIYDASGAAASALSSANAYTDTAIDALSETVATKANASDLTSHTGNTTVHITSTERTNWNAAKTHADSVHAPSNAEENQNAFSNVVVNGTTISADSKTDTLTFVAGSNITITPDSTGDSITISSANTVYTHPTTAGNKHIPAGGSSGQILRWSADGTAVWGNDNNTTYSNATQTSSGLMSDTDKTKLDGVAEGANNYVLPSAGTSLGGVKTGGDVTISSGVITVNDDSHNHVISNVDGLQSALDAKAASGHDHDDTYYTETEVDALLSGKANTSHTHTIANITNLQSTLDGKAATSHGTHVSYSTTAPVMDGTASVGTATTVARSDHKHPTDTSRAAQTSLDSHTSNKSNPHGVSLTQLGVTATANELNTLDGITATVTELNYVKGVTSNIQTQLNNKAASSHTHSIANITNLQTTLDGKAASSHTHKVANISDLTATATELNYMDGVTSNVQTQLDSKAASSHNHSASNITSGTLSSDRLPTVPVAKGGTGATTAAAALTNLGITATASELNKLDGVTATTAELNYVDGVTSNIQTQLNAKASSSHTHNYAGSSSAGGAATSANKLNTNAGDANTPVYFSNGVPVACTSLDLNTTGSAAKLTTARNIALGNDLTGSANFDGSGNITISAKHYNASVNSGNKSNYPYHRIAYRASKASPITGQYNDTDAIFSIREAYNGGGYGILKVSLRTNNSTTTSQASATWLARNNFALDDVKIGLYNVAGATYADIYLKVGTYARTTVSQLEGNRLWTLVTSNEVNDTTTSDALTSTECYVTIETAATTLHGQAYTSIISSVDGGQVNYANSAGSATTASTCSGNSATATKLATTRTISLTGDVTGSTSFDGSGNVSITATVADDSHNHTIANVDGLQTALDGKSATSHTHTAQSLVSMADALFATSYNGGVEYSYGSGSGKNVLTEISNMSAGLHTIYSIAGTTGNPKTTESWRMLVHKTSVTIGWVLAFDAEGSIYSNYQSAAGTFKGWRCIYDVTPPILWMGEYWCTDTQTVTPSKALSACRNGWVLVWSDYDTANEVSTNGDCFTTVIPKWNPNHVKWSGQSFIAAVPTNLGTDGTISFAGKRLYVHDTKITGNTVNDVSPSNDVCLRAIYEY